MVILRLKRMGTIKKPFFRIVAADRRFPKEGRILEELGHYDPKRNPATIKVNKDRALYWLKVGARPTLTVKSLLKKAGVK